MRIRRFSGPLAVLALALGASVAQAQSYPPPYYGPSAAGRWFVEGNIGGAWGNYGNFSISDTPGIGAGSSDASFAAGVGVGYFISNNLYARMSYRYFGSFSAASNVLGEPVGLDIDAHGLMLGLGANLDLTNQVFLEASGEIGFAFLRSSGTQFGGLAVASNTETNLAGGLGLGLGYHLTSSTDLLVNGNYHWLGDAKAGPDPFSATANDLTVFSTTVGLRLKF